MRKHTVKLLFIMLFNNKAHSFDPPPAPRSALIPSDSSYLTKEVSIPPVNEWPTVPNNQGDVQLFRR